MDFKVKNLAKSEVEITVSIPSKDMLKFRDQACEMISKEVKIKGFRSGKAPYEVLVKEVGEKVITEETERIAIQTSYSEIVLNEKINVIARPKVELKEVKEDEDFTYTAKVAVLPEVELKDYQGIKIKSEDTDAKEEDIQKTIDQLCRLHQVPEKVDGPAKKGHRVEVDFEGFDDGGAALENTKSKNHPIVLGDGNMIPGFEEELIGLKSGEKKEFDITFPKEYHHKPFQSKKVKFKVEVKLVEKLNTPELSDELAEKISGRKMTAKELKEDIKKSLSARKLEEEKGRQEGVFIEELIKKSKIDIPASLLEDEIKHMLNEFKQDLEQKQGIQFEEFLAQSKKTEDDLKKEYEKEAEKRIKARLILSHVLKEEKIEVTDKEMEKLIEDMIKAYPPKQQYEAKKHFKNRDAMNRLKNKVKLEKLFEKFLPAYANK